MAIDLEYLANHEIAVRCDTRAEAVLLSQITDKLCDWGNELDYWDGEENCFDFEYHELGPGDEETYREDGYQIISLRTLFVELCGDGFKIDLFAGHSVVIQVDNRDEELFLVQEYNSAISHLSGWFKSNPDNSRVGRYKGEPSCFSFGYVDNSMGFCKRSYYEQKGCVIFMFSELFDLGVDIEVAGDPEIGFLLC